MPPEKVHHRWITPLHNWAAWMYSCLHAKLSFGRVELVTDSPGARFLIDTLKMPYDSVSVALDNIKASPHLTKYGKVAAWGLQTEPFLHIESDVFLFKPLPEKFTTAPFVVQHDYDLDHWESDTEGNDCAKMLPQEGEWAGVGNETGAYNTGIFGGADVDLIVKCANSIKRWIDGNQSAIGAMSPRQQRALTQFTDRRMPCRFMRDKVSPLFIIPRNQWHKQDIIADELGYTHAMGRKNNNQFPERVLNRMKREYPARLEQIMSAISPKQPPSQPKIFAVTTMYSTSPILPHFIEHYTKLGVDQICIITNVDVDKAEFSKYPVVFVPNESPEFTDADKDRGETKALIGLGAKPNDWVMYLDLDEFHQYPANVRTVCKLMDQRGQKAIRGKLLDRVAADGVMRPITSEPLDDQFPMGCNLTKKAMSGYRRKIMLAKFELVVKGGRHQVGGYTDVDRCPIGEQSDYLVHHFRWVDGLVDRLEKRFKKIERYDSRPHLRNQLAFCEHYRQTGSLDLSNPELELAVAKRLSYPSE